jgi:RHS repeat-associated protein
VRCSSGTRQTRYGFTGQDSYESDFGLLFYNARFYDPYLNHFTQPDSIVPDPYNSQDYDRYSYVRNNPIRYNDPTGHFSEDEIDRYLKSIGIDDADERAKILAQWKDDDEWWKVIGPEGATYGDVIDGTKLFLGKPYGERIVLKFTRNENDSAFGILGNDIIWDAGGAGVMSSERLYDSNYNLTKFYNQTSDVVWMRPDSTGKLTYQGGTGCGGDGAKIQWGEAGNAIGHSAMALPTGIGGVGLLADPEI